MSFALGRHLDPPGVGRSDERSLIYACLNLFNLSWSQAHLSDNQSVANLILKLLIEFPLEFGYIRYIFDVRFCHPCLGKGCYSGVVG